MTFIDKIKKVIIHWDNVEFFKEPLNINLDGYKEYKLVEEMCKESKNLQGVGEKRETLLQIPTEILNKHEEFKQRVLEGNL